MARVLCCWERGAALGHLSALRPFVERAVADNHDVTLAARELGNVPQVYGELPIKILQAPIAGVTMRSGSPSIRSVGMSLETYYGEAPELLDVLVRAWDGLFEAVKPDLVIYDHSPTALIASLERPWTKWVLGSGFLIPRRDLEPFGMFPQRPGATPPADVSPPEGDTRVLAVINQHLCARGLAPLADLSDIWGQADREWLITLPELDHFGERPDTMYLGIPSAGFAEPSHWPDRSGPKVVGYLAECDALHPLLAALDQLPINGVFYTRDLGADEIAQYPNLMIHKRPLDLPSLLQDADLMINMAGHKTVAETYLAGVPQLMIVRHQEQLLLAWRVMALKAGVAINAKTREIRKPLQAAFGLMKRGIEPVSAERAREMSGARLMREIDAAFNAMTPAP